MARYRLTRSARRDIGSILRTSGQRHGPDARARYAALLVAAMRRIAEDPEGPTTRDRRELHPGLRSFHIRHGRDESREAPVADPAHVIFYRVPRPDLIEIVRVLHERMEPSRHLGGEGETANKP